MFDDKYKREIGYKRIKKLICWDIGNNKGEIVHFNKDSRSEDRLINNNGTSVDCGINYKKRSFQIM